VSISGIDLEQPFLHAKCRRLQIESEDAAVQGSHAAMEIIDRIPGVSTQAA
jgi:exonuclease VII large subunit